MSSGPARLLNAEHLVAGYAAGERDVYAVDDVSLYIDEGEVLGVAGESGCGKTTLGTVLALTARPPLYVKSGTLEIDGRRQELGGNRKVPRTWRGSVVSMLPQGAMNSISPTMRVRNLVVDVMRAHGRISKAEALDRAHDRVHALGLPSRVMDSYPHQLSGGMTQRVIAMISTLLNPRLLIADEPTSALDVSSQKQLIEMLKEMLDAKIMSGIIFITHDLPVLRDVSDRIAVMYAGKIAEIGKADEIVSRPRHPYSAALLNAVLTPDPETRKRRIQGIPGSPPSLADPPSGCRYHPRCGLVMDICRTTEPPHVGDDMVYARCFWAQQNPDVSIPVGRVVGEDGTADTEALPAAEVSAPDLAPPAELQETPR